MKCDCEELLLIGLHLMTIFGTSEFITSLRGHCIHKRRTSCSVIRKINSDFACYLKKNTQSCKYQEKLDGKWAILLRHPSKIIKTVSQQIYCGRVSKKKKKRGTYQRDPRVKEICENYHKLKRKDKSQCVLYRRQNITCKPTAMLIPLCLTLKPGMKMTLNGEAMKGKLKSVMTLTRDPYHPTNAFNWVHINLFLSEYGVSICEGFKIDTYKTDFLISASNITLTLKQTRKSTMIYVNNVLITPIDLLRKTWEINLTYFRKVHFLVVEKITEECGDKKMKNRPNKTVTS